MSGKRTYQKPVVTKVELRPEEAVLTGCKKTGLKTSCGATGPSCTITGAGT